MEHLSIPDPPGFERLSKAEQLKYLQALWDRISQHPSDIPAPEQHLELAESRLHDYRENPDAARPAHEVIDQLAKKNS